MGQRVGAARFVLLIAGLGTLVAAPCVAKAQEGLAGLGLHIEARAGVAAPVGELADSEAGAGFTFGLGISYPLARRFAVRAGFDAEFLAPGGDLEFYRYTAGIQFGLVDSEAFKVLLGGGVGWATAGFQGVVIIRSLRVELIQSGVTTTADLQLQYRIAKAFALLLDAGCRLTFVNSEDRVFEDVFGDTFLEGFNQVTTIAITAGLEVTI